MRRKVKKKSEKVIPQSDINIGMFGHVDHGKTTLVSAISNVWTDKHSESIKRSMTIKLGYADAIIKKIKQNGKEILSTQGEGEEVRRISLLDNPGHESLMSTVIASSSLIDAAILVIAANDPCPMPQTFEHFLILQILGIKNIVIAQTKIDLVNKERAIQHYNQIKDFLKGTFAEKARIIPIVANFKINIEYLLEEILKFPKRDPKENLPPLMYVARSFDVNKPGKFKRLTGGVVGGSLIQGKLKVGDEIEIRPGIKKGNQTIPIFTTIQSIRTSMNELEEARGGGLIALSTNLDPSFTKSDSLIGSIVGKPGLLPELKKEISLEYHTIQRKDIPQTPFAINEPVILGIGTGIYVGFVKKAKKENLEIELKHEACPIKGEKIAISRRINQRWRLVGYGEEK
ncbi:MAG: translation initiation factor IF-2 subunit gamma [Candidatus Micrarchaeia archaeon]|jgi:translation initiation factor 2 subunit 3